VAKNTRIRIYAKRALVYEGTVGQLFTAANSGDVDYEVQVELDEIDRWAKGRALSMSIKPYYRITRVAPRRR